MARREWRTDINSRGHACTHYEREHVSLPDLKLDIPEHSYLHKETIPNYPKCVFSVSTVCHVTSRENHEKILRDEGFKGKNGYLYWNLSVTEDEDDIATAEQNFLNSQMFPSPNPNQTRFLENFTTSPAFQDKVSRYGECRFTFRLRELLKIYSKAHCGNQAPILRVFKTQFYKKEIVYSILVHPRYMRHYRKYPRLPYDDKSLCGYKDGKVLWRCQSPSDHYTHNMQVDKRNGIVNTNELGREEYYVFDIVEVVFHMKHHWKLHISQRELKNHLSYCEHSPIRV